MIAEFDYGRNFATIPKIKIDNERIQHDRDFIYN